MRGIIISICLMLFAGEALANEEDAAMKIDGLFLAPFPELPNRLENNSKEVKAYSFVDTKSLMVYTATYNSLKPSITVEQLMATLTKSALDQAKLVNGQFEKDMFVSFFGYMRLDYSIIYTHDGIEYEKWATLQAYPGCMVNWSIQSPARAGGLNAREFFNKNAHKVECGPGI